MKIVYGGSFNPPTLAHTKIIERLITLYPSAGMIIVPVGDDYRKKELVSFHHRYMMIKLATKHIENIMISTIEDERPYQGTLATLKELEAIDQELLFVIGSDNLVHFDQWINYKELLSSYPCIVMNRSGYMTKEEADLMFQEIPHKFIFLDFDYPIASSQIRNNVHLYRQHLSEDVYQYIKHHHVYEVKNHV
ncbi:MAG: nicotinate (nicotinamide) nucleotide adenylyltransferase [Acholeplasma sp.]|jgi:nicotinate-nucleotide adenylyltransferase|nr:MAG: nicotinate (nicotinamide) nucleotide adenylyltransferase [Acholeplasma sp.]